MIGSTVSPMAWTRSCDNDWQWRGSGISACDICPVGGRLVFDGISSFTTPIAEIISLSSDGGEGSAVRFACFLRIFRVASLLA